MSKASRPGLYVMVFFILMYSCNTERRIEQLYNCATFPEAAVNFSCPQPPETFP